ncbi:hypothetical protein, partial [Proteus mirabilis]|uniref:hypothetical protein n=1 Tax=Proteus mirabilis TaxID=584 RepID=UPI00391A6DDB
MKPMLHKILCINLCVLSVAMPKIALSDNYFDPNLLLNNNDNIDLSNFSKEDYIALMNPLMILVKIIKLRWIHILSYDQMV